MDMREHLIHQLVLCEEEMQKQKAILTQLSAQKLEVERAVLRLEGRYGTLQDVLCLVETSNA